MHIFSIFAEDSFLCKILKPSTSETMVISRSVPVFFRIYYSKLNLPFVIFISVPSMFCIL